MKRGISALLTLALCLALVSCAKSAAPQGADTPTDTPNSTETSGVAASENASREPVPMHIGETLHVEFVVGDRDIDELLALQSEFPQAFSDALEKQNVTCDAISVTFGTSDEATLEAIQNGAVDIGFVSAEIAVVEYPDGIIAIVQGAEPDLSSGVIVLGKELLTASWDPASIFRGSMLSDLAPALARYTGVERGGVYVPLTDAVLEQLRALYEAELAEQLTAP